MAVAAGRAVPARGCRAAGALRAGAALARLAGSAGHRLLVRLSPGSGARLGAHSGLAEALGKASMKSSFLIWGLADPGVSHV